MTNKETKTWFIVIPVLFSGILNLPAIANAAVILNMTHPNIAVYTYLNGGGDPSAINGGLNLNDAEALCIQDGGTVSGEQTGSDSIGQYTSFNCSGISSNINTSGTVSCGPGYIIDYSNNTCVSQCPILDNCSSSSSNNSINNTTVGGTQSGVNGLKCSGGQCTYTPLEPLPNLPSGTTFGQSGKSFFEYFNAVITLLIIIGAMIAVVKFSIGGIMYMVSEVANTRAEAKKQMWSCIWGLLLLISSVLILKTLNPQLVNFSLSSLNILSQSGGNGTAPSQTSQTQSGYYQVGATQGQ